MKKLIPILTCFSLALALATSAIAQQNDDQQQNEKKKHEEKGHPAAEHQMPPKANAARPAAARQRENERANEPAKARENNKSRARTEQNNQANPQRQAEPHNKMRNAAKQPEKANQPTAARNQRQTAKPEAATPNTAAARPNKAKPEAARKNAEARKPQVVQKIKQQHANFHAQARPHQVPSVSFTQDRHIRNSEHWLGQRYAAFRSYRPERHDEQYYRSHYSRIELIGGGYYYYNAGYWYPAWGYRPSAQYYAYDGPIYVGTAAEPPDRVIADVQASLQEQGYYKGEVDGLLGPLTRQALTEYQSDNGLYTTAAIDEPTLASLGMD